MGSLLSLLESLFASRTLKAKDGPAISSEPHPTIPLWAASEASSSQSKPQDIPPDQNDTIFSWAEVARIIESNRLDLIRRKPSERLIYKAWCKDIIADYGSITSYMCQKRLGWVPLPASSAETGPVFAVQDPTPFADGRDYCILRNDWPYGAFSADITHLIVWLKPRILVEPETGLMTDESKALAAEFVKNTFVETLKKHDSQGAEERVLWFKNWTALQSVRGLEHIHILVRNVSDELVSLWTGEKTTN